jgi:thiol-disulfide isomerase/thioredoxin
MEGVLLAFQINLGFFCRFCLIYSVGVFLLTGLYLALAPRTFNIFAIPFGTAFLSIFLLYFSFAGASLEKAFIAEEDLGGSDQGTFYLFYSHTCGHCIKTLQILDHNKEKLAGKFRLVVTDTKVGQAEVTKQAEGNLFVRGLKGVAGDPIEVSEDTIDQCSTARRYMAKHAISETPTMIVVDGTNWTTTIHGTTNIVAYLSLRFGQEIVREIP